MKTKLVGEHIYTSCVAANVALGNHIDNFYGMGRCLSHLECVSPMSPN